MDYTREPIIETVITPKEGCKLVVRSSKSAGQEEYFVDAVEVVSFGNSHFFRSIERPKSFLVPATDYEVLEVREARMVLKNVGIDKKIKIGGGREPSGNSIKESHPEQVAPAPEPVQQAAVEGAEPLESKAGRLDKRRDKRRNNRRRRGATPGEAGSEESGEGAEKDETSELETAGTSAEKVEKPEGSVKEPVAVPFFSALLPPPPTLISETIARYRDNAMFKDAFFIKEEDAIEEISEEIVLPPSALEKEPDHAEDLLEALEMQKVSLEPSSFGSFEHFEEEELLSKTDEQNGLNVAQDNLETDSPDYTN